MDILMLVAQSAALVDRRWYKNKEVKTSFESTFCQQVEARLPALDRFPSIGLAARNVSSFMRKSE